ncbi:MAG: beta-galactosidase [Rhodoferax sp.]|nr:beta-galactosidase [Rhodoferax sp.]
MNPHPLTSFLPQVLLATLMLLAVPWAEAGPRLPERDTFYLMPTVEGLYACEEGLKQSNLKGIDQVNHYCIEHQLDGATGINRLLDQLEPGGPKGQVQVGYVATLQLLALYKREGSNWVIDDRKLGVYLQLLANIQRPVVVYLSADHFDSQGPLVDGLLEDPRNLMLLRDGKPAMANYFGYRIVPYTLQPDDTIAVNHYRYTALKHVIKRLGQLPKAVQDRIIAVTLPGELHQMFTDFESGTGRYQDIRVTDYSTASVAGFRRWLAEKYGNLQKFNAHHGSHFARFDDVPAPSKDIHQEPLTSFFEHYDAFADGTLPIAGWLWDPQQRIKQLDLYIDGSRVGPVPRGLNRLDVYRALADVTTPNVGYRYDLDVSRLTSGQHLAQIVASDGPRPYLLGQVPFAVKHADNKRFLLTSPDGLKNVNSIGGLSGVKTSMDLPKAGTTVYFNPLARDWNQYRGWQVRRFMDRLYQVGREAGLPAHKIYSHQILPGVNSSWNPQLFAVEQSLEKNTPWKAGINLYGGATNSDWVRTFLSQRQLTDYGVPEFNPQQWKRPGVHLEAMRSHYLAGARFISPYYLSAVPDRYRGNIQHGVNAMELRADNPKDGSDQFYQAIRQFAEY